MMVIVMESRLERYKRKVKNKKIKRKRRLSLFISFIIFILSVYRVDSSFRIFLCEENKRVFSYSYADEIHNVHLFGENYYLPQDNIDVLVLKIKDKVDNVFIYIVKFKNRLMKIKDQYIGGPFAIIYNE